LSGRHVAVIGGGYSGTLLAIHLLDRGARVTLVERADRLARGVAYSTPYPDHLLNVRAAGMSAFPERADHFAAWAESSGTGDRATFVQRRDYGRYLAGLLEAARSDRLALLRAEARDVTRADGAELVHLGTGERVAADAVVLALGNLPPEVPRPVAAAGLADGFYAQDPWSSDIAAGLGPDDAVLLLGTGLTAVDAALLLDSAGFRGPTLALSRRGLLPRAHSDVPSAVDGLREPPEPRCTALLPLVRGRAAELGWREAVDSLRPVTQSLWAGATLPERRRFLRHLRPWWDVHRHRIAPSIGARIDGMIARGALEVSGGKIAAIQADGDRALLHWRPRGQEATCELRVARIVNCTGPQADIARAGEPLLDALLAGGRIRPDPGRIGVEVDPDCRTLSADGRPSPTLRAVGPITRGAFWEIVAVPDIRHQVRAVAESLA
jgi:uncharacterized NAD(P)/FAD-binding protein YdhS